jgi:hypothetical protein
MEQGHAAALKHRRWRRVFWTATILAIVLVLSLAPYLTSSTELVRLRNALLYQPVPAQADWTPAKPPEGYLLEQAQAPPSFQQIVLADKLAVPGDDWLTALRIGRHLLAGVVAHRGNGGPIQEDLSETYQRIRGKGEGYCGDYVDVFTALANTAGIFTRSWAFSFDGFGGYGHIFNEIWDRGTGSWRMIDVFNNYYVVDEAERPLSALEFRKALLADEPIRWRAVEPAARPGYKYPEKAVEYFRRGASEWYLWWGNNVFEYDQNGLVSLFSLPSRSLGQLAAIAAGVHPPFRVWYDPENESERKALERVEVRLAVVAIGLPLLVILMLVSFRAMRHTRGSRA